MNIPLCVLEIFKTFFGSLCPLLIRSALSALDASCDCACCDQASCIGAAGGPCARCAPFPTIGRLLPHRFGTFLCAKEMTPIMWPAFGAPFCRLLRRFLRWVPAATAHATIRHHASGLRAARAHVAHLFVRSGGSDGTCFVLFVCEGNDPDYVVACFWCSFADSDCAFCAGCQLRPRMLRSGMMHRGRGRPVRTLRTFCDDRAAPVVPLLYFLCAKQMTPII